MAYRVVVLQKHAARINPDKSYTSHEVGRILRTGPSFISDARKAGHINAEAVPANCRGGRMFMFKGADVLAFLDIYGRIVTEAPKPEPLQVSFAGDDIEDLKKQVASLSQIAHQASRSVTAANRSVALARAKLEAMQKKPWWRFW